MPPRPLATFSCLLSSSTQWRLGFLHPATAAPRSRGFSWITATDALLFCGAPPRNRWLPRREGRRHPCWFQSLPPTPAGVLVQLAALLYCSASNRSGLCFQFRDLHRALSVFIQFLQV
ncbi:hypothetical protein BRADI_4g08094v3 [Brachypodium distachyon]|uniref:Uncharacterized protein n=1 Tax=Brachypodium distachyon TaxID=15368 RepID=A0A2K2CL84_BRADI|nr:hypothetical protein BRADI_4g08094v3 [Brachypodium distachyon]